MLNITRLVNSPVPSNCYIVSSVVSNSCLIIDPGIEDCIELISILRENELSPEYIILTHEHIDHIVGINKLKENFDVKLVTSAKCGQNIISSKYNLSGYSEKYDEYVDFPASDIILDDINYSLNWCNYKLKFTKAEGHSLGSIILSIDNNLFTGDTLLKGYKTNTSFPGASKENLLHTLEGIINQYNALTTMVYPGHDDPFYLYEVEQDIRNQIIELRSKINKKLKKLVE
jgi:hydroxyacylglutathione hydrolase